MTIVRQFKTAVTGPNVNSLPRYFPPLGGRTPANRWIASHLTAGPVTNWPAALGTVALSSGGTAPVAAAGAVTLDGVDDVLQATITVPKTFYMVAKTDGTYVEPFFSFGNLAVRQIDAAGQFALNQAGGIATYGNYTVNNAKHSVIMVVTDGVTVPKLYVNGVAHAGTNIGAFSGQLQLGKYSASVFGGLNILDAGAFTNAMTDAEALAVYNDLKALYSAAVQ